MEPVSTPDSTALLRHETRKKRLTLVVAVAALAGLGGGGYFAVTSMGDGMAEVNGAYAALSTCMIGEPLGDGESVEVRMSGIEVALHGMTGAERAERGADWPNECQVHAHKLSEVARQTGKADPLADAATALATELEAHTAEPPAKAFGAVVTAADTLQVKPAVDAAVRQPPKPKARPSVDTLPETARLSSDGFNPGHLHVEPFQSRDIYFLMDEENLAGGPQLCDYRPKNKELGCKSLPERVAKRSPHLRLWGTTELGGDPFLYVGDRGKDGIYRSKDGKRIGKKLIYGADAKKSGNLVATFWDVEDQQLLLAELREGEKSPTTEKLLAYDESHNPYYNTGLFWGWFVYRDWDDQDDELHLYARSIEGVGRWGKLIDIGSVVERSKILENDPPHIDACRDGELIVIRARGLSVDRLAFYDGKKWHPPVPSPGLAGTLTCHAGEAVITQLRGEEVWQNRCKPTGCDRLAFSLAGAVRERPSLKPSADEGLSAAEAGGSLAVAWRAPGDGLRLVVGKADTLKNDAGRLVLDEKVADGKLSMTPTVLHHRLLGGRGYALLIVSTIKGNYVLEVLPDGSTSPVVIKRD